MMNSTLDGYDAGDEGDWSRLQQQGFGYSHSLSTTMPPLAEEQDDGEVVEVVRTSRHQHTSHTSTQYDSGLEEEQAAEAGAEGAAQADQEVETQQKPPKQEEQPTKERRHRHHRHHRRRYYQERDGKQVRFEQDFKDSSSSGTASRSGSGSGSGSGSAEEEENDGDVIAIDTRDPPLQTQQSQQQPPIEVPVYRGDMKMDPDEVDWAEADPGNRAEAAGFYFPTFLEAQIRDHGCPFEFPTAEANPPGPPEPLRNAFEVIHQRPDPEEVFSPERLRQQAEAMQQLPPWHPQQQSHPRVPSMGEPENMDWASGLALGAFDNPSVPRPTQLSAPAPFQGDPDSVDWETTLVAARPRQLDPDEAAIMGEARPSASQFFAPPSTSTSRQRMQMMGDPEDTVWEDLVPIANIGPNFYQGGSGPYWPRFQLVDRQRHPRALNAPAFATAQQAAAAAPAAKPAAVVAAAQ